MKLPMFENSAGERDYLLTASTLALATVLLKVALNGAVLAGWACGTIDAALVGALLVPTLGAYTAKRVMVSREPAP